MLDNLKLMIKLTKGEINFEAYFKNRGLTPRGNLNEVKYLIKADPIVFNLFFAKLTIGVRCLVMKTIFDLNDRLVQETSSYNSKTSISNFIESNFSYEAKDHTIKKVKIPMESVYELSIILDVPSRYLASNNARYKISNSFDEYENDNIRIVSLKKLIEEVTLKANKMIGIQRKIFGVNIKREDFFSLEEDLLNTRVDIRSKYFTIEIHLLKNESFKYTEILKIQRLIQGKSKVFIQNAFLRSNKKLVFLVYVDEYVIPEISYLYEELNLDNIFTLDNILAKGKDNR